MQLLIDAQALQSLRSRRRGIGRYACRLLMTLETSHPDWRIQVIRNLERDRAPVCSRTPPLFFQPPLPDLPHTRELNERYYADWIAEQGADALLILDPFDEDALSPRFVGSRLRVFAVVYDLIPLRFPAQYLHIPATRDRYADCFRRLLRWDGLFAISQATAVDIQILAGEPCPPIVTIGGACDPEFVPLTPRRLTAVRQRLCRLHDLANDFILYVGGADYRKNLMGAMQAFALLPAEQRRRLDLVIACALDSDQRQRLGAEASRLNIASSLRLPGEVTDEELRALYQMCRVFFFPSLHEGLGIPVLEALRMGAPVVASNCSAIQEYAWGVAHLADPSDPAQLADALALALQEPRQKAGDRRMAHAQRFRWEDVAQRLAAGMLRRPEVARPRSRPRIAWVSPLPPTPSGVADSSATLLPFLLKRHDIELVIDPAAPPPARPLAERLTWLRANELDRRHAARPFDMFVYHLGASHLHAYMAPLLAEHPGVVVLHDVELGGLVLPAVRSGLWRTTLEDELRRDRKQAVAEALSAGRITADRAAQLAPLNRWVFECCRAVIVHSAFAWRLVRPLTSDPVFHVPLPVRPAMLCRDEARRRLGMPSQAYVICTLGTVGTASRLPSLLRAVAALPARAHLIVVGTVPERLRHELAILAARMNIACRIRFTGRVSDTDFAAYARAADVCVQLRYPSRGESSAALLTEFSVGAACIVSDHGPMADLPYDVALRVPINGAETPRLTEALCRLDSDVALREQLGRSARAYVRTGHAVGAVAARYSAVLELARSQRIGAGGEWLDGVCQALAACKLPSTHELLGRWAALRTSGQRRLGTKPSGRALGAALASSL